MWHIKSYINTTHYRETYGKRSGKYHNTFMKVLIIIYTPKDADMLIFSQPFQYCEPHQHTPHVFLNIFSSRNIQKGNTSTKQLVLCTICDSYKIVPKFNTDDKNKTHKNLLKWKESRRKIPLVASWNKIIESKSKWNELNQLFYLDVLDFHLFTKKLNIQWMCDLLPVQEMQVLQA